MSHAVPRESPERGRTTSFGDSFMRATVQVKDSSRRVREEFGFEMKLDWETALDVNVTSRGIGPLVCRRQKRQPVRDPRGQDRLAIRS